MATLTLTFPNALHTSLQIGDTAYYMNTQDHTLTDNEYTLNNPGTNPTFSENQSGNPTQAYSSAFTEMGMVTNVSQSHGGTLTTANQMQVFIDSTTTRPAENSSFILFSKDARANMSSLLGYYAEVEFVNTSDSEAEIFAVNSEIVESSK
tara:strand:+ start:235 stop:684 length:450 start_codon:yes stop_codon:yes gene_type:complete